MRLLFLVVGAVLLPPRSAVAQANPSVLPGQRVRVSAAALHIDRAVGRVTGIRRDTLFIDADTGLAIPLALVSRLDVSRGRSTVPMTVGAVLGVATGAAIGLSISGTECLRSSDFFNPCDEWQELGPALFGAAIGGLLGTALGSTLRPERWGEVSLRGLFATIRWRAGPGGGFIVVLRP